ncbi:ABC transporter substrate-binding protein [Actinoplanes sp. NPDC051513]|uniref:ABC transporter substrate-binding protein n=1 Tax=Actinoplanes sp. NPDC051513 TaxID=3363908 RepID=UPI0037991BB5
MRRPLAAMAAFLLLLPAACGDSDDGGNAGDEPLKIGLIVSLTGNYAPLGSEDEKSVKLAVQQINDAGGLLGRQIELTVRDDKSQPEQSVLSFNDLKSAGVAAVIGSPFSNSALATIPQVDRAKIPYVSLTPADEQVNPIHPYVFVVPATSATYADRILQYFQAQGFTKVAVAHDSRSSYANAGTAGMKAKAAQYGVTLVADEEFQTSTTEFGAIINHVKSSGAQALTVWATGPPGVAFAKQYASAGVDIPLMFTGSQASSLWLKPAGPAAEGVFVASSIAVVGDALPAGAQKTAIEELSKPFTTQYGYPPPQFAADGYTGMKLLAAAVTRANSDDPAKIQAAFEGLTLTTPNGVYKYTATDHAGLTSDYISINQVKGGAFVPTDWAKGKLPA